MPRGTLIQIRKGSAALWASVNPILAEGELGLETDTGKIKGGNGTDTWSALPYSGSGGGGGSVDSVNGQTGVVVLDKGDIGLSNVDNTADLSKPISTATQTALDAKASTSALTSGLAGKQDTLTSGTNIKTVNGTSLLGSGDLVVGGSNNLDGGSAASTYGGANTINGGGASG